MSSIRALWSRHEGRPAVVLGGGPSLVEDAAAVPQDAVRLSVNEHGLKLIACDYVVYLDPWVYERVRGHGAKKVTYHKGHYSDYHFEESSDVWNPGFSSAVATWLAAFMNCDPIILAGMDCYAGDQTYWHTDGRVDSSGHLWPVKNHVRVWGQARQRCPRWERIRVVSGPLLELFPRYEGEEHDGAQRAASG